MYISIHINYNTVYLRISTIEDTCPLRTITMSGEERESLST